MSIIEENDQTRARRANLEALRRLVGNVYPNKFERSRVTGSEDTITSIVKKFRPLEPPREEGARPTQEDIERANEQLKEFTVRTSGRIATPPRVMGKAAFVHLSDGVERLQTYVRKADVRGINNDDGGPVEEGWEIFNLLDHGDFIGVEGYLFITKTGELSVHVEKLQFLAKALLPMPDKMHGIADPEIRQRQRYADLIAGSLKVKTDEESAEESASRELTPREVFEIRSKVIREMRRFLDDHGYIEVETPMLTPLATGAAAKPFKTHHNALDIDLFARIAPELYLKRLLVGGFEKVYELNRNFRNEGIGYRWNPEFTMLEFYCAYMDVNGMMDFSEDLLRSSIFTTTGHTHARFGEEEIDFSQPFERLTMKEAIAKYWPQEHAIMGGERFEVDWLEERPRLRALTNFLAHRLAEGWEGKEGQLARANELWEVFNEIASNAPNPSGESLEAEIARLVVATFEYVAEGKLIQPTFIYDFPKAISPLSKASPFDPSVAERFELYIAGMEIANGFSELNDPVEQRDRFLEQMQQRERGDEEAMVLDEDYIRALSYGMPPAAGIGIGVDRLMMVLTGKRSIRDVILFPHMRPERNLIKLTNLDGSEIVFPPENERDT